MKKIRTALFLLVLTLLLAVPALAADPVDSITLSSGRSYSFTNNASTNLTVKLRCPDDAASARFFFTHYNADGSINSFNFYDTTSFNRQIKPGEELIITAETTTVCEYYDTGISASSTSEQAAKTVVVKSGQYLTLDSTGATANQTVRWNINLPTYVCEIPNSGSLSYNHGNRTDYSVTKNRTVQLSFPESEQVTIFWPTRADLTGTVLDGDFMVSETIPVGSTIHFKLPTSSSMISVYQNGHYDHSYVRYKTADCSNLSYDNISNSNYHTINSGYTYEIAATTHDLPLYFPTIFLDQFGLTYEIYEGNPLTYITVPTGSTIRFNLPTSSSMISVYQDGHYDHSYVRYKTADCSNLSYDNISNSNYHTINSGYTYEIAATTHDLPLYFPTIFLDQFGLTYEIYEGNPLTYITVPTGSTIRFKLPSGNNGVSIYQSGYCNHAYLHYWTSDFSHFGFDDSTTTNQHTIAAGNTAELAATTRDVSLYFPNMFVDQFGLSYEIYEGNPLTFETVPVGSTLRIRTPATLSFSLNVRQAGYKDYGRANYRTADYGGMTFTKRSSSNNINVNPGYTTEVSPGSQAITYFYPTFMVEKLGMTTEIYEGPAVQCYTLKRGDALRLTWPSTAGGDAPINATEKVKYDLLTYPTGQSAQQCTYREHTGSTSLKAGHTADISTQASSIDIYFPSALLSGGMQIQELYSYGVFYRVNVKQGESVRLVRPPLSYPLNMTLLDAGAVWDYVRYKDDHITAEYLSEDWNGQIQLRDNQIADLTCLSETATICIPYFWKEQGLLRIEPLAAPAFTEVELNTTDNPEIALLSTEESSYSTHSFELSATTPLTSAQLTISNAVGFGTKVNYFQIDSKTGVVESSGTRPIGASVYLNKGKKIILQPIDGTLKVKIPKEQINQGGVIVDGEIQKSESVKLKAGFKPVSTIHDTDYIVAVVSRTNASKGYPIQGAEVTLGGIKKTTDHNGLVTFQNVADGAHNLKITHSNYYNYEATVKANKNNRISSIYLEYAGTTPITRPYIMSVTGTHDNKSYDLRNQDLLLCKRTKAEIQAGYKHQRLDLDIRVNWGSHGKGTVYLYPASMSRSYTYLPVNGDNTPFYPAEAFGDSTLYYLKAVAADGTVSNLYNIKLKTEGAISNTTANIVDFFENYFSMPDLPEFMVGSGFPFMGDSPFSFELEKVTGNKLWDDGTTMAFAFGMSADDYKKAYQTYIKKNPPADNDDDDELSGMKKFFSNEFKQDINNLAASMRDGNKAKADVVTEMENLSKKYDLDSTPVDTSISDTNNSKKRFMPEITYGGYCQLKRENSRWVVDELCLTVCAEVDATKLIKRDLSITKQWLVGYVPIYFSIGLSGGAEGGGKIGLTDNCSALNLAGLDIGGNIDFHAEGGAGVAKVATLSIDGDAGLELGLEFEGIKINLNSFNANLLPEPELTITGGLSANLRLLGYTLASANIVSKEWQILPKTEETAALSLYATRSRLSFDTLDLSAPLLEEDLSYRDLDTYWSGNEPQISTFATFLHREERQLLSGIDPDTQVVLSEFGGKQVLLWLADNTQRADRDRSMLVFSVLAPDLGTWSTPAPLWDNGFSDHLPAIQGDWVVWQKLNTSVAGDNVSINDIALVSEVAAAHWNGNGFDSPIYLTENTVLDAQPVVASSGGNTAVVWTRNTENNLLGLEGTNSVLCRTLDSNGIWSEEIVLTEGRSAITSISAACDDSGLRVVINEETDNSLDTIDDRNVVLFTMDSSGNVAENNVVSNALNPQLFWLGDTLNLFYHKDQTIWHTTDLTGVSAALATLEPGAIASDAYSVASNDAGNAVLLWSASDGNSVEIFGAYYDGSVWTCDIQFSSGTYRATRPTGIFSEESVLDLAYVRSTVVSEGTSDDETSISSTTVGNLCTLQIIPACDLSLGTISYDSGSVSSGETLDVSFPVTNRGEIAVDAVQAHIYTKDGTIDTTVIISDSALALGERKDLTAGIVVPDSLSYQPFFVEVLPIADDELNPDLTPDDNLNSTYLGGSDLSLSPITVLETASETTGTQSYQLWTTVTNLGLDSAAGNFAMLRHGSLDGDILATQELPALAVGESVLIGFTLDVEHMRNMESDPQISITVSGDSELYDGNNSETLRLMREDNAVKLLVTHCVAEGKSLTVESQLNNLVSDSFTGHIWAAAYCGNRMIGTSVSDSISLNSYETKLVSSTISLSEEWTDNCVVRLFFLDDNCVPLADYELCTP